MGSRGHLARGGEVGGGKGNAERRLGWALGPESSEQGGSGIDGVVNMGVCACGRGREALGLGGLGGVGRGKGVKGGSGVS